MRSLLQARPLKVFIILAGIPLVGLGVLFIYVVYLLLGGNGNDFNTEITTLLLLAGSLQLLFTGLVVGWLRVLGKAFMTKTSLPARPDTTIFNACLAIPVIYAVLYLIIAIAAVNSGVSFSDVFSSAMLLVGLLKYVAIAASLYAAFAVARMLKSLETGREVKFEDFAGEFFLLIIYPIGIWFLQPRIIRLTEEKEEDYPLLSEHP